MSPLDTAVLTSLARGAGIALLVGAVTAVVLLLKSTLDFTRTGPEMAEEVLTHYRLYLVYSLARLAAFAFAISAFMAFAGIAAYVAWVVLLWAPYRPGLALAVGILAVLALTARQFARTLLFSPGVIAASSLYSMTHFYSVWRRLTPRRLRLADRALLIAAGAGLAATVIVLALGGAWIAAAVFLALAAACLLVFRQATRSEEPSPAAPRPRSQRP
ncbi:MAG TPA: hypothetical protein VF420_13780, partial [Casimicrobiaceae bacterium]